MTDNEVERLAAALVEKWRAFPNEEKDLDSAIRTTVVDTYLVVMGFLKVEDFEP